MIREEKVGKRRFANMKRFGNAAEKAMRLWDECFYVRDKRLDLYVRSAFNRLKEAASKGELPIPKSYPVSLDEFLRLIMPKKRPADRMKLYREYLRLSIRANKQFLPTGSVMPYENVPIPSDDEVSDLIKMLRARQFNEEQYKNYAEWFLKTNYLQQVEAENRRKRAQAGAAGLKRKRHKNHVDLYPYRPDDAGGFSK